MILKLVEKTMITGGPELEKLYEYVTRELKPAVTSLRTLFNALMNLINYGTFPLGGKLASQGIRFTYDDDGTLAIGNDDDGVGNFAELDITDIRKIRFGGVWVLTGDDVPTIEPICVDAPFGSIYMRRYSGGEPLCTFWVRRSSPDEWIAIA